jgi:hypothetical protein
MRTARAAHTRWRSDEASPDQVLERVLAVDSRKPRDRLTAARDHDFGAPLDAVEMLAQPVVKLTYPDLIALTM